MNLTFHHTTPRIESGGLVECGYFANNYYMKCNSNYCCSSMCTMNCTNSPYIWFIVQIFSFNSVRGFFLVFFCNLISSDGCHLKICYDSYDCVYNQTRIGVWDFLIFAPSNFKCILYPVLFDFFLRTL